MSSALSPSEDLARMAERIRDGDRSAEDELAREFSDRVRVFVQVRTRDREVAHDLRQEIMTHALTALRRGQLRERERLAAFVYGIARNVVNNYFRRGRDDQGAEPLSPELVAANDDPATEFENRQRQALVRRALARLNRDDRTILLLTLVDGLKPGEIADRLGLTAEVVRVRKSRAVKKVAEEVHAMKRNRSDCHLYSREGLAP